MKKLLLGTLSLAAAISLNATVLATVDGKNVTEKDMNAMMQGMRGGMAYSKLPADTKKKLLDQAIERKLLIKNAMKSGVEKSKEYKEALANLKESLALDVWMKKQFNGVKVTKGDIKKYYEKNGDKFVKPARAKARHILLKDEKAAKEVIGQMKGLSGKKLEDKFVELAKTKSTGPSAKNGGELGFFAKNQMLPAFSEAAFKLKKGEISKTPVKTKYGYHVILKQDSEESKKVALKDVEKQIENGLKMEKFREKVSKKAKSLRKGAKISIKDKSVATADTTSKKQK